MTAKIALGGHEYEAYLSVADADVILAVDPQRRGAWSEADADAKGRALVAATQRLDLLRWRGKKAGGAAQALAFPRSGLAYEDGSPVPADAIPADLKRATALLAGSIQERPGHADQGASGSNISEIKAGPVTIKNFRPREAKAGVPLQDETAYSLVLPWLLASDTSFLSGLASGTDQESSFAERNPYGHTRGY